MNRFILAVAFCAYLLPVAAQDFNVPYRYIETFDGDFKLRYVENKPSGLAFDLSPLRKSKITKGYAKIAKSYAKDGMVSIAAIPSEGTIDEKAWREVGQVLSFLKNPQPLTPGHYAVRILFPDDREVQMPVEIRNGITFAPITLGLKHRASSKKK